MNSQAEVSELLNTFFVEIGPSLSRNVANVDTTYEEFLCATTKEFIFEKTTTAYILSLLSKLCKSKATGLDKISAKLLKECPDLIAESLTLIFNQSLSTGILPMSGSLLGLPHYTKILENETIPQIIDQYL